MIFNKLKTRFKLQHDGNVIFYPFGFTFHGVLLDGKTAKEIENQYSKIHNFLFNICIAIIIIFISNSFQNFLPSLAQDYIVETMIAIVLVAQILQVWFFLRAKKYGIKSLPFNYNLAASLIVKETSLNSLVLINAFFIISLTFIFILNFEVGFDDEDYVPIIISMIALIVFGRQLFVVLKSRMIKRKHNV